MDDDPLVLRTMSNLLGKAGYVVQAYQNSRDAVEAAAMEDFDLIIADIRMPEIDGFQAIRYIREIRSERGKQGIPEIFVTGYAKDYQGEVNQLSPHAIIHKPFDLQEFLKVVQEALK